MKNNKLTFIDLFAGCGGLSEGFLQSGKFDGIAHVEWEIPMVRTLRKRLSTKWEHTEEEAFKNVIHFDIQKTDELINGNWTDETKAVYENTNHKDVSDKGLRGLTGDKKVNLIIGGPPCQAYSVAGRAQDKNSMKDDYRNYLFESFIKVVDAFQPEVFVFENVPGMLSAAPGDKLVTERIFESFSQHGYLIKTPSNLKKAVQTASDFGVPQKRNRVIIIGIRNDVLSDNFNLQTIYDEINKLKSSNIKTVKDAIGDLPVFKPTSNTEKLNGRKHSYKAVDTSLEYDDNLWPRFQNERDIKIFREWVFHDMNKKPMEEKIDFYNRLLGKNSNHAKYRNLEWDKPSQTIVAHLYKDGLMFIHPDGEQARSITVKEAALLQSFPNDFEFIEKMGNNYKMIGNAVPPLMAKKIAIAISEAFKSRNNINWRK
ncbi:DNA cytosine methyltransferase [Gelidibacter japonicus]|uniref:DNA cytosine methyltransferase n=1 Tax=Gelidibacter japonicus TaxID=1962232 RepID=UPI0020226F44|nr:DNA cytosine methyltransferase [Gelidibacter japonicus]MCL8007896.1 DNA cytosine methyltransferase [Gelidibacter japonicus]